MPDVKIAEKKVWVGNTAIPLLSGELHYWRLDPHSWRDVLQPIKAMGIKTVATYACWDFHELAPGQYDFTGKTDPRRNLVGFLELLRDEGFWLIFRPGPYIYSEWSNNGAPDHAARFHRLDPQFQARALPYMEAVTEAARPFLATNGGNIILWQSDNEIDPWPHLYTEALGLGSTPGVFHEYLCERYASIDDLNAAWRTHYRTFEDARAVSEMFREDPAQMSRYNDYRGFIHWYVNQVARWGVETYKSLGVDVPIILNAYSGVSTQRWADLEAIGDLVGSDIYPSREYLYRPGEQRHILEAVRYSRTFSKAPYIAEFESGIWHDWLGDVGTLTPNHYRLICLTALQGGAAGWNWYMLVNRDNWYQCPINEWGRTRPALYDAFRHITALYEALDPSTLEKICETAVTFDPLQRSTQRPGQELLQSLHDADIDYEFFDLDGALTDKPILFYAGGSWLSAAGQDRLLDYVEAGGHLVCVGAFPTQDEHMQPLNLLELPEADGIIGAGSRMNLRLFGEFSVESAWVASYAGKGEQAITVERLPYRSQPSQELGLQFSLQEGLQYTAGYTVSRGQGQVTVLGLQPTPELLLALHEHFGVPVACRSQVPGVTSALFRRGDDFYLIATNDGSEAKSVLFSCSPAVTRTGRWQAENLTTGEISTVDFTFSNCFTIMLGRKDGAVVRLRHI